MHIITLWKPTMATRIRIAKQDLHIWLVWLSECYPRMFDYTTVPPQNWGTRINNNMAHNHSSSPTVKWNSLIYNERLKVGLTNFNHGIWLFPFTGFRRSPRPSPRWRPHPAAFRRSSSPRCPPGVRHTCPRQAPNRSVVIRIVWWFYLYNLPICLPICLSIYLPICLSFLSISIRR